MSEVTTRNIIKCKVTLILIQDDIGRQARNILRERALGRELKSRYTNIMSKSMNILPE